MGSPSTINLKGKIHKASLKKEVKTKLIPKRPDLRHKITDRVLLHGLVFISGYIKCFEFHSTNPLNEEEVLDLLYTECMEWMVEYVEKGGK